MTALIVGNGPSRKTFDIAKLVDEEDDLVVYGCNALYRDFKPNFELPHFLIAIDEGMITEIESSSFPSNRFIVPPEDEMWEPVEYSSTRRRSNAGMNAMQAAIRDDHTKLICIGFDFLMSDRASLENVYDKTSNYELETRSTPDDNQNRCRFLSWFCAKYDWVDFIFTYPMDDTVNREFYIEPFQKNTNVDLDTVSSPDYNLSDVIRNG